MLRETKGSGRLIALVCLAVVIQIARNWLLLNWSGVDASVFDSTALLIGLAVIGLLPIGPSLGAATTVLILGADGVARPRPPPAPCSPRPPPRAPLLRELGDRRPVLRSSLAGAMPAPALSAPTA